MMNDFKTFTMFARRAYAKAAATGYAIYPFDEALEVFRLYFEWYEYTKKRPHPNISVQNMERLMLAMPGFEDGVYRQGGFDVEFYCYEVLIPQHFKTKYRKELFMAIELATQFQSSVDELFYTESKHSIVTNQDYSWDGANAIKVYSVTTSQMNDYGRGGPATGNWSRYGPVDSLDATTQSMALRKDRSFTFAVDRLDVDETKQALAAAAALARQLREVTVPEIDTYVFNQMCTNAGQKPTAVALTATNIYDAIVDANKLLDDAEVPETGRALIVTPAIYLLMKKSSDIIMETDIGNDMRLRGVIANLDGMTITKVPANRLPDAFGFMIAHPVATVAPVKLSEYQIHQNPPGISGDLVEGRFNFDAFILNNKADAVLYQAQPATP